MVAGLAGPKIWSISDPAMLDFRPDTGPEDLVESSDDLGPNLAAEVDGSEDDDSDDDSDEDVADIGEEAGVAAQQEENPFFADSDSDVSDTEDEDDEEEGAAGGSKEPVDEEDDLIKALKAAREKKVRNCPPDIKTADMVTDLSFHPEQDLVALAGMAGDLAVFRCVTFVINFISIFMMTQR